jgi:hypothetical protein
MDKHIFPSSDPAVSVTISADGLALDHPADHPVDFRAISELSREILRLAELVRELEGTVEMRDGTLAMTVARLGGEVEGAPTHRGNFLQRIDQLRREESDLWAATVTAEDGQEIIAELTAALAVLFGENLTPCAGGCPGHLGPKAGAAAREALDRWTAIAEENRALKESNRLDNLCDVCGGNGTPISGRPCACGGTGSMRETVAHLRVLALIEQPDRIAALEAEVERLKGLLEAAKDFSTGE